MILSAVASAHASIHRPIKFGSGLAANMNPTAIACQANKACDGLQLEKRSKKSMPRILGHSPHQSSRGLNP